MKKEEREEDSGLHDIRNLAQSTKQRLSSRRVSTSPISDEDALASASGSWKNIALPQPAKMVALPELADLPSKADVRAAEKAAKEAAAVAKEAEKVAKEAKKAARDSKNDIAAAAPAAATSVAAVEPAAAAPAVERKAFALPSAQSKSSKGPLFALVGLGVAAAAGGVIYMQMGKKSEEPAPQVAAAPPEPVKAEVTTTPIETPPAAPPPVEAAGSAVEEPPPPVAAIAAPADKKDEDKEAKAKKAKVHTVEIVDEGKKAPDKPAPEKKEKAPPAEKATGGGEGEPSFDQLLKEAGVDENKKEKKPTLDKKELSGDDFKKGMSAVAANAKACYAGNQGIAMMKLVISPEGKVSKVTITGAFAGKPEADCVSNAVKSATFPPWDGGPQSFNFSYMLAE
ncbi:MAG: hypothetical protein HOV81_25350 [Kofleriaceae bacterium]|nr:hypothetical protein [Kofleriaceae bacterium]